MLQHQQILNSMLPDVQILYYDFVMVKKWNFEHNHMPFWRLYYNFSDGASIEHNGNVIQLDPGKIVLLSPDTKISTSMEQDRNIQHFFVHFDISSIVRRQPQGVFQVGAADMKPLINMICSEKDDFSGLRNTLRVRSLVTFLLSHLPDDILEMWRIRTDVEERIRKVITYLQENYNCKPENEKLASIAKVSKNQLLRDFRQHTGLTPQAYLRREQIRNACILLNTTTLSIDEIAERTGFFDRYHFSKIFRKVTGLPPVKYRNRINPALDKSILM